MTECQYRVAERTDGLDTNGVMLESATPTSQTMNHQDNKRVLRLNAKAVLLKQTEEKGKNMGSKKKVKKKPAKKKAKKKVAKRKPAKRKAAAKKTKRKAKPRKKAASASASITQAAPMVEKHDAVETGDLGAPIANGTGNLGEPIPPNVVDSDDFQHAGEDDVDAASAGFEEE